MRVGIITGEYPPMKGGVGAFTREVCKAMTQAGHEPRVFTRVAGDDKDTKEVPVTAKVKGRWSRADNRAAAAWAEQHRLDAVNIQFQTAAYDLRWPIHILPKALAKQVPCFVTFHDLREPYLFPKAGKLRQHAVQKLAADATGVIATDRMDEKTLRESWQIRNVRWIPIGSNVTTNTPPGYNRERWRSQMNVEPTDLLISYFGFLNESKGGETLIHALATLHERGISSKLVMIGDRAGSSDPTNYAYAQQIDALIKHYKLQDAVHWSGFVENEAVSAYFGASDICVLPYRDGVSLRRGTLMAALAHGMPIITTHPQIYVPEIDGAVQTVSPDAPLELAQAIIELWQNLAEQQMLGQRAQKAHRHFRWDTIATHTIDFFTETIQKVHANTF